MVMEPHEEPAVVTGVVRHAAVNNTSKRGDDCNGVKPEMDPSGNAAGEKGKQVQAMGVQSLLCRGKGPWCQLCRWVAASVVEDSTGA